MSDAVSRFLYTQTKRKLTHALPTTDYPTPTWKGRFRLWNELVCCLRIKYETS